VLLSTRHDAAAARRFFTRALETLKVVPSEVVTDAVPVYPAVLAELMPAAWHHVEQYANNPIEADHGGLKHRLRPMRGLQTDRTAQVVIARHAFLTPSWPPTPTPSRTTPRRVSSWATGSYTLETSTSNQKARSGRRETPILVIQYPTGRMVAESLPAAYSGGKR
jgi:hypothetical protein